MSSSNLRVKKFNRLSDYEVLKSWFDSWNWTAPNLPMIPNNSYFVIRDDELVAFSCFLTTDTNMALMGYTIVNRSCNRRLEALDFLLEFLVAEAKNQGFEYMQYYTTTKGMVSAMEKQGFVSCSSGKDVYLLVKNLGGEFIEFFDE